MSAKTELMLRLKYLSDAADLPNLVDNGIAMSNHNGVANLLRKGLGIVAFNILEDFIKNKSIESLSALSNSTVPFTNLTEDLQRLSVSDALSSLHFRSDMIRRNGSIAESMSLIQTEAYKIHSTSLFPFQLSDFTFVSAGSNITDGEISTMIKAFGISGGWDALRRVSNGIGGGIPDLSQAYKNAASRRHQAAHAASFNYDHPWITNIKNEILAISASLDILLTARCRQVSLQPELIINLHDIDAALNYRFLEPKNGIYKETRTIGGNVRKNWNTLEEAIEYLQPLLITRNEFLVVLNSSKRIENWYC